VARHKTAIAGVVRTAVVPVQHARSQTHNAFKVELARRAIVRTLTQAARGTPQSQSSKHVQ
jgi:xanthine dehydrogenase YagS FAD-binding subunit